LLAITAALTVTALSATSLAQANPVHSIRWSDTGLCQVRDNGGPMTPWLAGGQAVSAAPTSSEALAVKQHRRRSGGCTFC
jgi:hypothetical protein